MTSDETKYLDFIQYVFDRPIKISNAPEWYWDINIVPFVATKQKTA